MIRQTCKLDVWALRQSRRDVNHWLVTPKTINNISNQSIYEVVKIKQGLSSNSQTIN